MSQPKITMYMKPGCPDVARTTHDLTQRGLTWDEINIETDDAARQQVIQWTGRAVTPTLWIGDIMLTEPNGHEIDEALAQTAVQTPG